MRLHIPDKINPKFNVEILLKEDDEVIDRREAHNIWVNVGRNFIAKVLGWPGLPFAPWGLMGTGSVPYVRYMGIGIGSDEQTIGIAAAYPVLNAAHLGQNVQDDSDSTIRHLERPVAIEDTGTVQWLTDVVFDEPGSATNPSNVIAVFTKTFAKTDINVVGTSSYPVVPVSEVSLALSDESATNNPYTGGVAPTYVGPSRQVIVAYNGFAPLSKTVKNTLEIRWELRT